MMKDVMPEVHRRLREKRRREREQGSRKPRRKVQRLEMEPAASVRRIISCISHFRLIVYCSLLIQYEQH